MSLDWNKNGRLDAADFFITEMLDKELEEKKKRENENRYNSLGQTSKDSGEKKTLL